MIRYIKDIMVMKVNRFIWGMSNPCKIRGIRGILGVRGIVGSRYI